MLIPPDAYREKGWKVWTVGDDICWMRPGEDGRLYAINPEAGYFGVAPGTSDKSNPNALASIQRDTIFTNVAVTDDNQPWWEGLDDRVPVKDWQGRDYVAGNGKRTEEHTSELQSLMRISYAVFCLKKKKQIVTIPNTTI